ncbi:hypothetical protein Cgig2_028205 [Carnegiea gigantea]|uniref:Uncharacterized protein n=1 Tax=Carnegiea gigantea TaxID=171969 RepID=A0A9Q1GUS0_9CARY|nr:hypothetical protein Cgig2_028205 [Carnegiea gigantea]
MDGKEQQTVSNCQRISMVTWRDEALRRPIRVEGNGIVPTPMQSTRTTSAFNPTLLGGKTLQLEGECPLELRVSSYAALFNHDDGSALKFILNTIINGAKREQIEKHDVEPKIIFGMMQCLAVFQVQMPLNPWNEHMSTDVGPIISLHFVKIDKAIKERSMLYFARMLIYIPLEAPLPELVDFINDHDTLVRQKVDFEWKLT